MQTVFPVKIVLLKGALPSQPGDSAGKATPALQSKLSWLSTAESRGQSAGLPNNFPIPVNGHQHFVKKTLIMGRPSHVSSLRADPQQSRGKRGENKSDEKNSNYMKTHPNSASLTHTHLQANEHRALHHPHGLRWARSP